jgi:hypothetical protein
VTVGHRRLTSRIVTPTGKFNVRNTVGDVY